MGLLYRQYVNFNWTDFRYFYSHLVSRDLQASGVPTLVMCFFYETWYIVCTWRMIQTLTRIQC